MTPRSLHPVHAAPWGFTIVEIVIVLSIIGLLTAIVAPRIDLERYQVNTAMEGVGATLLMAQRMAVTKQHDVIVIFDVANAGIMIHEDANNDGTQDDGERVRREPLGDKVVFGRAGAPAHRIGDEVVTFDRAVEGRPALTFHRNGSASEAGGFYLTARRAVNANGDLPGYARAVEIVRATGRVSWHRFVNDTWQRGF
jgi:type II secretory pathway pseudopilin PulG